jgi:hypothetical protein
MGRIPREAVRKQQCTANLHEAGERRPDAALPVFRRPRPNPSATASRKALTTSWFVNQTYPMRAQ